MARKKQPFTIESMESLKRHPQDDRPYMNPFNYDHVRMGEQIAKNVVIMFYSVHNEIDEFVVVDTKTGNRIKIKINSANKED